MTMGHYLKSMEQLTRIFKSTTYRDPKRQRLYLKDIDCPEQWANHLKTKVVPEWIYYLNECIEPRTGGDGSILEPNEYGQMGYGKGVAPAGDLMSSLPPAMRAENMMCYIGHEGTYTAAHREMCGTLGHNIMVEASSESRGEKPGSSIWFMTETKEREVVSEYFLSMLGHDIEVEKHFAQVNAWKKAPFNVWVVEQKAGDLILIPPLAPHQVWNRGTRTMKVAWNRTTVDTLELALHEALPRARMVCREEQYKCKAIIYFTLIKYHLLLQRDTVEPKMWKYGRIKQLLDDFKRLFYLYQEILVSEMFSPKLPEEENVEFIPYDSFITCSYCRGNIFNRFLTCKSCIQNGEVNGEAVEDTYDVCMDCYAMGRSCACISNLAWVEQWDWSTLVQNYEQWRNLVVQFDGYFDAMRSPQPLDLARKRYGRKPIAEVCQEQLKLRPFKDATKERTPTPEMSDVEPEADDEGRPKPRKGGKKSGLSMARKGRVAPTEGKTHTCHICMHHDWNWKLAFCTTCSLAYCYGTLWRAFDLMPQNVMEDKEWQCPRCLKMCSCGKCRKPPTKQTPYQPKGTLLGHDTRKVADFRSVESLVDFSRTNQSWLRDEDANNPQHSTRMKRLKEKAEAEKARSNESFSAEHETQDNPFEDNISNNQAQRRQDIDPSLLSLTRNDDDLFYQDSFEAAQHVANSYALGNADESNNGFAGAHYELDGDESYNQHQANYPSRLLAPATPMSLTGPRESYPNPSVFGQTRMMGVGYFHQNGAADRILYDSPVFYDGVAENSQPLSPSKNPNMLFSDLLDPKLQQVSQPKKRKKIRPDREDPEDVEFFASKRQKLSVETKKHRQDHQLEDLETVPTPQKRMPRRSTNKPQSYRDLGEAAVPIEDEGPSLIAHRNQNLEHTDSDLELAVQALSRLSNLNPKEKKSAPTKRRRSMRDQPFGSLSVATNIIKTPRKSAWLLRKEAEDADKEFPSELPKRTRKHHSGGSEAVKSTDLPVDMDISPAIEKHDNGTDRDSLFGELIEPEIDIEQDITALAADNSIQSAERDSAVAKEVTTKVIEQEKSAKKPPEIPAPAITTTAATKRRGRPPKNRDSIASITPRSESPMASERTEPAAPASLPNRAPAHKLLSLKEKLALKGKRFKIVAAKSHSMPSPGPAPGPLSASTYEKPSSNTPSTMGSSSGNTPSVIVSTKLMVEPPAGLSSSGWKSVNGKFENLKLSSGIFSAGSPSVKNPTTMSNNSAPAPAVAAPQKKKGPTVVRLMSEYPDSEQTPEESSASDSSDNEIIPNYNSSRADVSMRGRPTGMTARRGRPTRSR
jgi:hypothetical protein